MQFRPGRQFLEWNKLHKHRGFWVTITKSTLYLLLVTEIPLKKKNKNHNLYQYCYTDNKSTADLASSFRRAHLLRLDQLKIGFVQSLLPNAIWLCWMIKISFWANTVRICIATMQLQGPGPVILAFHLAFSSEGPWTGPKWFWYFSTLVSETTYSRSSLGSLSPFSGGHRQCQRGFLKSWKLRLCTGRNSFKSSTYSSGQWLMKSCKEGSSWA